MEGPKIFIEVGGGDLKFKLRWGGPKNFNGVGGGHKNWPLGRVRLMLVITL